MVIALSTGMRQGEILGLTWDRVNLTRGTIIIEETKNGERRTVPLVGHAAQMMQQYRRVHRPTSQGERSEGEEPPVAA